MVYLKVTDPFFALPRVASEHTQVQPQGRRVVSVDLGNTHSTFRSDERVLAPAALRDNESVSS